MFPKYIKYVILVNCGHDLYLDNHLIMILLIDQCFLLLIELRIFFCYNMGLIFFANFDVQLVSNLVEYCL